MGLQFYEPTGISHPTSVDFSKRSINQPVHLVQYDKSLPILAVSLYNNGQLYPLPDDAIASIRLGKPDKTFVYNRALGCNSNRTVVYFEVTQQMTLIEGEYYPIIEITRGVKIANSSSIYIIVDRNPVQHDYIESTIECKELVEYWQEAKDAATEAKKSEENTKKSELIVVSSVDRAVQAESNALIYMNSAKTSADNAKVYESGALQSAVNASASASKAVKSEDNAKISERNSKTSETNAANSAASASANADTAVAKANEASTSSTNAAKSESNAAISETNAIRACTDAEESMKLAKSYAVGTDNTVRPNDSEDNARAYANVAHTNSEICKTYAEETKKLSESISNKIQATSFQIDFETGLLTYTTTDKFIFKINSENGNLEWEVTE